MQFAARRPCDFSFVHFYFLCADSDGVRTQPGSATEFFLSLGYESAGIGIPKEAVLFPAKRREPGPNSHDRGPRQGGEEEEELLWFFSRAGGGGGGGGGGLFSHGLLNRAWAEQVSPPVHFPPGFCSNEQGKKERKKKALQSTVCGACSNLLCLSLYCTHY